MVLGEGDKKRQDPRSRHQMLKVGLGNLTKPGDSSVENIISYLTHMVAVTHFRKEFALSHQRMGGEKVKRLPIRASRANKVQYCFFSMSQVQVAF